MDNNNENMGNENMMNQNEMASETAMPSSEEKSYGPLIGIVIIIVILIAGGLYFWNEQTKGIEALAPGADEVIGNLEAQGTSDEVSAIEEDLGSTDLESLDADLEAIESELGI